MTPSPVPELLAHASASRPPLDGLDPLCLDSRPRRPGEVVDVALGRRVVLGTAARDRMSRSRAVLNRARARGDAIYGVTTGVGALKTVRVTEDMQDDFNRALLIAHAVGSGQLAPPSFVRAAMVVRARGLALGLAGVRPAVVEAFCAALNANLVPRVHELGSIGQADLSQMAEIGLLLTGQADDSERLLAADLKPLRLEPREAHAIVNSNAYSVGVASLALELAQRSVETLELSAALSYEAICGNVDALHPAIAASRPYPGLAEAALRLREALAGGALARGEIPARNLQDPLCFKGLSQTHGVARDALTHLEQQLTTELASSGDSPLVLVDEDRAISTGSHEIAPVAIALDYARLGLAGVITIANERIQKLLTPSFSGLPSGLRSSSMVPQDGLAIVGHGAASVAAEARLLAAPVTLEQPTSSLAEGIEDRITMAPAGAHRLYTMSELALRLAAVELICAAQAIDLRGVATQLGRGTRLAYATARQVFPSGPLSAQSARLFSELTLRLASRDNPLLSGRQEERHTKDGL